MRVGAHCWVIMLNDWPRGIVRGWKEEALAIMGEMCTNHRKVYAGMPEDAYLDRHHWNIIRAPEVMAGED
jgi:hypothetical protein